MDKYKEDLIRLEINPPDEITIPYNDLDDILVKLQKIYTQLQQRRTTKNRVKMLLLYFLLGKLLDQSGQQHLNQLMLSNNQLKKMKLKAYRTYHLFKKVGIEQIYNTKYINVSILIDMGKDQFEELSQYSGHILVSQELNA